MDDKGNNPLNSDQPVADNYASAAQDAPPAMAGDAAMLPLPGQGLNEALHGNAQEGEVFYGDVGVDRDIDATVSGAFSGGHHPVRNPLPEAEANSDLTYLDDAVVAAHGVAGATTGGAATDLSAREQGAAADASQDLEFEDRIGTTTHDTFSNEVYGAGQHDQSVGSSASGPISQLDAPNTDVALGSFGMPGSQQIQGLQLSMTQPATQGPGLGSDGRPRNGNMIHPRGGTEDGYAYQQPDDHNPTPVEDIAGSVGERYIASSVAYRHGKVVAHLTNDRLNPALVELRSIGIKDEEIEVLQEGADNVVHITVDNLNRPYVEQVLHKYGK